jgi:autoinducer 2 (AI-2) kinase
MSERYFLTVDAGTGSGRAIIFDTKGRQISIAQEEWTHLNDPKYPGSMTFDTNNGWLLLSRCIKSAIAKANINPKNILAVTATSMREGIVLWDKDQKELFGVANVDARADKEVASLKKDYPGIEKEFYKISGQTFALGALPRLLWVKNNMPKIYEKTAKISMISDWVLAKLSNTIAADPSNAGTTGIFSLKSRDWEPQMAAKIGLKSDIFPKVYESGAIIGEVTKEAANETGLEIGTPVVMGGGDVQLGCAGLGVVKANQVAILGGTFWQQLVNMDRVATHPDMDIRVNPHVIKGLSQAEGITFFSGLIMRWFRDTFCQSEKAEALKTGVDAYTIMEKKASSVPAGSYGILPIFSDKMHYGKWYHAAPSFLNLGIDPKIYSKEAMFRSLEENAAIVTKLNLDAIFSFTNIDTDTLVFAGGASKGELWCQILSDATGKRVKVPKVTEATALGGAYASAAAVGVYSSISEAAQNFLSWDKEYEPNKNNFEIYQELSQKWQEAYKAQLKLVDDNITTSMWKAPGI